MSRWRSGPLGRVCFSLNMMLRRFSRTLETSAPETTARLGAAPPSQCYSGCPMSREFCSCARPNVLCSLLRLRNHGSRRLKQNEIEKNNGILSWATNRTKATIAALPNIQERQRLYDVESRKNNTCKASLKSLSRKPLLSPSSGVLEVSLESRFCRHRRRTPLRHPSASSTRTALAC